MTKIELPEMPPAVSVALIAGPQGSEYRHLADTWEPDVARHSESQLRARDRQIVELCAQVCDARVMALDHGGKEYRREATASQCATAIRNLLGDQLRGPLSPTSPPNGKTADGEAACPTCRGEGEVDERIGGDPFAAHVATCPDCNGTGNAAVDASRGGEQ